MAEYNVHAGHNPSGEVACGAVGLLDESKEARLIAGEVIRMLKLNGHTAYNCTVDNGTSASDVLKKVVVKCNGHTVVFDLSIHLNSGRNDKKGDDIVGGFEVLVTSTSKGKGEVAERIRKEMKELGFKDRGTKIRNDLYVLKYTKAPALLLEICFVDDKDDYELYKKVGYKKIAEAIVKGLLDKDTIKTSKEFKPYLVKVTSKTLKVRSGAGTKHKKVTEVEKNEVYTIIATKMIGKSKWGKLKSSTAKEPRWVNLKYTKKC